MHSKCTRLSIQNATHRKHQLSSGICPRSGTRRARDKPGSSTIWCSGSRKRHLAGVSIQSTGSYFFNHRELPHIQTSRGKGINNGRPTTGPFGPPGASVSCIMRMKPTKVEQSALSSTSASSAGPNTQHPNVKPPLHPLQQLVSIPIDVDKLDTWLEGYDLTERKYLVSGFRHGFHIPQTNPPCQTDTHMHKKHASATQNLDIVDQKLQKELLAGRIAGPFQRPWRPLCLTWFCLH